MILTSESSYAVGHLTGSSQNAPKVSSATAANLSKLLERGSPFDVELRLYLVVEMRRADDFHVISRMLFRKLACPLAYIVGYLWFS